jgi:predicted amidohydrolase YtcJ
MHILHNAKIYTLNTNQPTAAALAIDDHAPYTGRVLAVGDDKTILDGFSHRAETQDMEGAVILPGLTDAHIHLKNYAFNISKINLFQVSKAEALQRVAARAKKTPPGGWIEGHGWNQNDWPEGFPTASDLDAVAPDNPVFLTQVSLHTAWANSAAFKIAGIDKHTPDPANGQIQRDENGDPTGIMLEGAADLIASAIPPPGLEEVSRTMIAAQETLWQVGLTGVHAFEKINGFKALQMLRQRGELKLRVLVNLPVEQLDHIVASGLSSNFGDDMLHIGGIKVFMDGALGSQTAAMLEPYLGEPQQKGMLFLDKEDLFEIGRKAVMGGLRLAIHAIGDAANREALRGLSQLRAFEQTEGYPHGQHQIEHVQLLHPDDVGGLAELDVIASMQPIHATSDMVMADTYWGERSQYSYAWRTLLDKGTRMSFGSDAPVDSPNPFHGIYAAVTRRRADGSPGPEGWYPAERITVEEAIRAYTTGPAYAAGMEHRLGQLAPGYLADLIVVDNNPFTCLPEELREITPQATMVGGDWVWLGPKR